MFLEATSLTDVFTNAGTVITKIIELMGTVGEALLGNVIFQIMLGVLVLFIVMGIIFKLVYHARKGR